MDKKFLKTAITAVMTLAACLTTSAQIPTGYYSALKGKKGAELKTTVHKIIKNATVLSYGPGTGHTWDGFHTTDRTEDNKVIDRYSNDERYFGDKGESVSGMNIEHSFPKSWWGGSENQAYKDLYNLMPCEQKINSAKSNYPMGKVTTAKTDNGCTKVGTGSNGYQLWEPADKWKGDFARGYMYMATTYQNFTWKGEQALQILQQGDYPTLQEWAYTLYIEWARTDEVDEIEVKRNNEVSKIQGNRNPFVDFPNLMEYIWGDSIDYEFNPETTKRSSEYGDGEAPSPDMTIYSGMFTSLNTGGFTAQNISGDFDVWTQESKYGWVGTGYYNNVNHAAEALLISPELDLTGYESATLTFNHAMNYLKSQENPMTVEVRCDGIVTELSGITWPSGNDWTFVDSGEIPLSAFTGKKINIIFHYKSTTDVAPTWEIKKMTVKGKARTTNIGNVQTGCPAFDPSQPFKAYSTDGRAVNPDTYKGIMIVKQGKAVWKVKN